MSEPYCSIGLINPKNPANVGAILRACGCFDANAVFYTGNRYKIARQNNPDTQKVSEKIPVTHVDDLLSLTDKSIETVCIELVEGATPLQDFKHPSRALYIFGPEDGNASKDIVNACKHVVYIPSLGSLNLAATANIILYDRTAKLRPELAQNKAIWELRDNNNNLKI